MRTTFFLICMLFFSEAIQAQPIEAMKDIDFSSISIPFEHASAQLKPEYISYVYKLADSLQRTPNMYVLVRGHVCCVNRNQLATKRANAIRDYLLLFGAPKNRVQAIGVRNSMPVVYPEKNKYDELANMRVDFVITFK